MRPVALAHSLLLCCLAAGCGGQGLPGREPAGAAPAFEGAVVEGTGAARPMPRPDRGAAAPALRPPPQGGRTAAAFDTTSEAERAAARAPAPAGGRLLGATIASLGSPAEPGFWLRTPLVQAPARGRVVVAATGAEAQVELLPSGGAPGSGSQLSLPAFRLLGLPLTALPELEVFAL
jgi:hypothetical protein